MKNCKVLGVDLAKNVFQIHGADAKGKCVLRKRLSRDKLKAFVANLSPCIIGIEACGGAHYWGRYFQSLGHEVRMMAPQFVKPYVKSGKNDRNDAEGIAEACTRPSMRYVPVKTVEQQAILSIHRARELLVKYRTAQAGQIRGLLLEEGICIAKGISHITRVEVILEPHLDRLCPILLELVAKLKEQFQQVDKQIKCYDKQLKTLAQQNSVCREIQKIPGIGPLIASGIVALIGDAHHFKNGREVSAWLGLVPRQHSSGDKIILSGINKRGDSYMRKLLIQGARTVVNICDSKTDHRSKWIADKKERCGYNKASVALANKNARIIWAIMKTGECYREPKKAVA